MATINERIKELRTEKGYTQEELAKMLGLNSKSNIANYENGANSPSDKIKNKLCNIFGCTMDYLMGNSDFKTYKEDFNHYSITQSKIVILKTIDRYYNEYVVPCALKESDINNIVALLSNVSLENVENIKVQLDQFINSFEKDKRKKVKELVRIIIGELIDDMKSRNVFLNLANLVEKENSNKLQNIYKCPVYGRIAAGQPNWAEECIEGYLPIDPVLMNIADSEECYFLRVNGESMNKLVKNGAFALIRKTDWVENGEVAVVLVNGFDATLKKFTKQGDLIVLEPMSDDPSFQTQVYDKNTQIKVIGKYIGKMEMN